MCEALEQTVAQLKQRLKAEEAKQGELAGGVRCMLWKHAGRAGHQPLIECCAFCMPPFKASSNVAYTGKCCHCKECMPW